MPFFLKLIGLKRISVDAAVSIPATGIGLIMGYVMSYISPVFARDTVRIYRNHDKSITTSTLLLGGLIGYGKGVYDIVNRIATEPNNHWNYIPIGINAVVGLGAFLASREDKEHKNRLKRIARRELREKQRLESRIQVD